MKNNIIYILTLLAPFFTACDDYVDLTPKGLLIPESVEELQLVLDNDDLILRIPNVNTYLMHDDGYIPASQVGTFQAGILVTEAVKRGYQFRDYFYLDTENDPDWDNNYKLIGMANYVLGRVGSASGSQTAKDDVRGQALVHRAFSYLTLVNMYARHYAAGDPTAPESGVPLVTEFGNAEVSLGRASIQQVYDLVITDLTTAVTLLSMDFSPEKHKATKVVAYGLLARAYLHMEAYELAATSASSALEIQGTLINYPTRIPELNYTLGMDHNPNNANNNATETLMSKSTGLSPRYFSFVPVFKLVPFTWVSPEVINLYDQAHDTRFTYLIDSIPSANAYRWTGADISFVTRASLTVPEVLLTRAESNARLGKINEAMDDLNHLREQRFDTDDPDIVDLTADTKAEAIQHTLEERRRELLYQGTRFFDIKRLNAVDNAGIGLERLDLEGNPISLPAGDPRWAIAIPPKEVALRPELKQNPR